MKLPQNQLQTIQDTLRRHEVKRADLFGSFARGDADDDSDIDILFEFKGSKSLLDHAALKRVLEEALNKKVDLVTYDSLYPRLKSSIMRNTVSLI
ncbi:MAG TPA: hypothetical protein DCY48_01275 [Candidatus Magasanikbacteria bacterium]|nr:MAG: hypothetical protein A3I74_03745 [Candidatus Magasanikbacteria bacterium RIFCSPLOWO2_02_FULL_47_16]OGH80190.1 MAG: hypothetical protein A3C10_03330 [Candidatus Magasanikbacteria bacterium RIFCSPHIGHO2_02_FULL_48_18]HAZ28389.1 hypothetical protein [Candidatus Magasanikbacteria bacterium]